MNPLVSIVIPCYNTEQYVAESIYSVCDQSYQDIEIIFVDDGSTDGSVAAATKALATCAQHREYRILTLPQNTGACNAVNIGFKQSCGKYAMMLAADDVLINPDYIADAVTALEQSDAVWCYSSITVTGGTPDTITPVFSKWLLHPWLDNFWLLFPALCETILCKRNPVNSSTLMIRMSTFIEKELSWAGEGNRGVCDGAILRQLLYHGTHGISLNELGVFYRTHQNQVSHTAEFKKVRADFGRT